MFGKSLLDLAAMQAESSQKFHGSDRELKQNPENLGGSAHGSQYNTRCAYMSAVGTDEFGDEYYNTINQDYIFYDKYVYDAMDTSLAQGRKCPSMTFTHDFGCMYSNLMTIVGEAKSESEESEKTKVVLGVSRVLNYSPVSFGIMLSETIMHLLRLDHNARRGIIEIRNKETVYCE